MNFLAMIDTMSEEVYLSLKQAIELGKWANGVALTDEQKEQLQKIEKWLRKVPEDPAYLLKRKMLLEQQRRQRQRLPAAEQKNW